MNKRESDDQGQRISLDTGFLPPRDSPMRLPKVRIKIWHLMMIVAMAAIAIVGSFRIADVFRWVTKCRIEAARCDRESLKWDTISKQFKSLADSFRETDRAKLFVPDSSSWNRGAAYHYYMSVQAKKLSDLYAREANRWRQWKSPSVPINDWEYWRDPDACERARFQRTSSFR